MNRQKTCVRIRISKLKTNEKIGFSDESFDSVLLFAVLTCIINESKQEKLITEINRVLKSVGIVYVNDFLINTGKHSSERYERFKEKYALYGVFELSDGVVLRHHDEEYVKRLFSVFDKIIFEKTVYDTMNGNKVKGFSFFGKKK